MIKGLAITPPILGRISIGKMVEKNGKHVLEKNDQFTLNSQIQNKDSGWVKYPLDEHLRAKAPNQKFRIIPIGMILNLILEWYAVYLNIRESYVEKITPYDDAEEKSR